MVEVVDDGAPAEPVERPSLLRRGVAAVLGLSSLALAVVVVGFVWGVGEAKDNVTDGGLPGLVFAFGLLASTLAAAAGALWRRGGGRLAWMGFLVVAGMVAIAYVIALIVF